MEPQRGAGEDRRPASRRVADDLKAAIDSGAYPVGRSLPSLRQLASEHEVAVNTAMAAVRLLADEGYVTYSPNRPSYVRDRTIEADAGQELRRLRTELGELRDQLRHVGGTVAAVEARLSELSDVAAQLENRMPQPTD